MFDRSLSNCVGLLDPENDEARFLETLGITCAYTGSSLFAHICNRSVDTGTFPSRLKFSIVRPMFKKGDNSIMYN
jgi:hypothetical protein